MKHVATIPLHVLLALVLGSGAGLAWHSAAGQTTARSDREAGAAGEHSARVENPIVRERFSSDPAALVHDGRVWLYTGHDEAGPDAAFFEMHDWQLYSSDDMATWEHHGSPISVETFAWARGDAWASQVIERDGKFYFYATVRHDETKPGFAIGVAVADRPQGPFVDARGSALISNDMTEAPLVDGREMDWDDLDPTVFIDDDGQAYLFWGNTVAHYARLTDDMTELAGPVVELDLPRFTEALWIHERDGTYYLSYAYGYPEQIAYATADEITGPYAFQGVINDTIPNSPTNHQSIVAFDGDWYFFYHNAALPGGGEYRRSVAVERLFYDDAGRIHPITQAARGLAVERPEDDAVFLAGTASARSDAPEYVTNPVVGQRADPWVYRHTDGYYYFTGSVPAYDRVELRRARTLQGLAFAEPVTVWRKHDEGPMSRHIWAPELHYIGGTWYVHVAAGREDDPWHIRMYVLATDAENPLEGAWRELGRIETPWDSFSLDATTFEHRGTRYLIWAQSDREGNPGTDLYMAEMETPWRLRGAPMLLSKAAYDWETQGYRVNEGAAVLKRGGRIFVTYSASATDARYAMGLLTADADADLMDPGSWTKSPVPVMATHAEHGVYGPGHNSFTVSADGTYDVLVYHARPYGDIHGNSLYDPNRQTRMQVLRWADDGTPLFGPPVPDGPHVFAAPSQE